MHGLYVLTLGYLILQLPPVVLDPQSVQFLFLIGAVGLWRYSWGATHLVRSMIYRGLVFPRWRAQAERIGDAKPSHLYLLVTSFRISTETTQQVYASVIEEALRYDAPTTIVASLVEMSDQRLVKQIFHSYRPPSHIKLMLVRIQGSGKRDGLASAFRAISRDNPPAGFLAAVIDGDSLLVPGLLRKCVPFFFMRPKLGALTTDEICEVEGSAIFRNWYAMRFAQRHIAMSSVSLSRRVLTLTGRMSMFRGALLTDPSFIARVELDWIDHWRLGRFRFLTGDDKSTWYWMLKNGHEMLYIPDAQVLTIETPPDPSFLVSSRMLMRRWFGNMLRTNGRAIALGPRRMGLFTWWCVVDQRISIWTTLVGPAGAILATFAVTPFAVLYYLCWIAFTRYVLTISLLTARPRVSVTYPFLLYYNQIVGALVKSRIIFQLDRQKWTRQNTTINRGLSRSQEWRSRIVAGCLQLFALGALFITVALLVHVLDWPSTQLWASKIGL
ncbi:MAG: glycosyltransferase [Alphaproteobacteria bacterium]